MKTLQDKSFSQGGYRLDIINDDNCDSPRNDDNLGYFITRTDKYHTPDRHNTYEIIVGVNFERSQDLTEWIQLIKEDIPEAKYVLPVSLYEHSGHHYALGCPPYHSIAGFYIVTDDQGMTEENVISNIKAEIENYNTWSNGEIYGFRFYKEVPLFYANGERSPTTEEKELDSAWGMYTADMLRDNLPDEAKTLFDAM